MKWIDDQAAAAAVEIRLGDLHGAPHTLHESKLIHGVHRHGDSWFASLHAMPNAVFLVFQQQSHMRTLRRSTLYNYNCFKKLIKTERKRNLQKQNWIHQFSQATVPTFFFPL
jgi:hypothetical protein